MAPEGAAGQCGTGRRTGPAGTGRSGRSRPHSARETADGRLEPAHASDRHGRPDGPGRGAAGRQRPLRRVRPSLPGPAGTKRDLRGPPQRGRAPRLPRLRRGRRDRDRPDREEAALPRRARHARLLDRHGRLPVPLHVLPELGDRPGAAARPRPPGPPAPARAGRRRGDRPPRRRGRLHLRRADGLPRVRPRHGPARPRRRPAQPVHHRRLRDPRGGRPPGAASSTPRTSISRRSTTPSTAGCAAPDSPTSSRRSWRCAGRGSGSS